MSKTIRLVREFNIIMMVHARVVLEVTEDNGYMVVCQSLCGHSKLVYGVDSYGDWYTQVVVE